MNIAVFWVVASFSVVELTDVSEEFTVLRKPVIMVTRFMFYLYFANSVRVLK
jgi:hypothetical protein